MSKYSVGRFSLLQTVCYFKFYLFTNLASSLKISVFLHYLYLLSVKLCEL